MSGPMSSIDDRVREIFEFVKLRSVDGVKPASMLGEIGQEALLLKVNGSLDAAESIWEFRFTGSDLRIVQDGTTWRLI